MKTMVLVLLMLLTLLVACGQEETALDETAAGDQYTVEIDPADFVDGIDNPYLPLVPGTKWRYEAHTEDGETERIELEVLSETRQVMGVTATILHDMVFVDDELAEDTHDWFAQDKEGNVWYLGEEVDNYEDGVLINHAGAWEWGVDGALPGIIMWADPAAHIGESYRQEYLPGQAEDMGQVLSVGESVTVPFGSFDGVLKTLDTTALEPGVQEHKYYAPGIGVIKEMDVGSGETMLLLEMIAP